MAEFERGCTNRQLTDRQIFLLASLAAYEGSSFAPVQVQKFVFLLDENLAPLRGGKHFAFEPYDYGPFDKDVYEELEVLEDRGLVTIAWNRQLPGSRRYLLTIAGQKFGEAKLLEMDKRVQKYMRELSDWVRNVSFAELVGAIYHRYPAMGKNSVFQRIQ